LGVPTVPYDAPAVTDGLTVQCRTEELERQLAQWLARTIARWQDGRNRNGLTSIGFRAAPRCLKPVKDSTDVVTVVIPAHDEAAVLARGLTSLLQRADPGEFEVIVVANACTDATAEVARKQGVRVIETSIPGKPNALRLGDKVASTFPRIYLDADVEVTSDSVRELVRTLGLPGVLATSPVPHYDFTGVRRSARRLHRVHALLMADRRGLAGTGAYCLNEAGHARVAPFPDVISDDGYVHRSFAAGERVVTTSASSLVRPAPTFAASLRRRVRVRQGNEELDSMGLPRPEGRVGLRSLGRLVWSRKIGPLDAGWYVAFIGADRVQLLWRKARRADVSWGTDVKSRRVGPSRPADRH
jgi:glycosyltransferase involved in cell wall biosynthesis